MGSTIGGELYHPQLIAMLERLWGEGWLSPGGADEVARLLGDFPLAGKTVLDIGSGAGGVDILLAGRYGAGFVLGRAPAPVGSKRHSAECQGGDAQAGTAQGEIVIEGHRAPS